MAQAKKLNTHHDKYFTHIEYEYRGRKYEVSYANGNQVCCTPPWIQHKDAQAKIDRALDENPHEADGHPFDLDEIWDIMEEGGK